MKLVEKFKQEWKLDIMDIHELFERELQKDARETKPYTRVYGLWCIGLPRSGLWVRYPTEGTGNVEEKAIPCNEDCKATIADTRHVSRFWRESKEPSGG